jgi:hypothetical protein
MYMICFDDEELMGRGFSATAPRAVVDTGGRPVRGALGNLGVPRPFAGKAQTPRPRAVLLSDHRVPRTQVGMLMATQVVRASGGN